MASEKQYTDLYRECRNQIFAHSADVMNAVRDAAFADFERLGFPTRKVERTLSIAPRKGSYKGMLQHRRFHIVLVGADSGTGDQPMQASKSVEYDGKAVKVQL